MRKLLAAASLAALVGCTEPLGPQQIIDRNSLRIRAESTSPFSAQLYFEANTYVSAVCDGAVEPQGFVRMSDVNGRSHWIGFVTSNPALQYTVHLECTASGVRESYSRTLRR